MDAKARQTLIENVDALLAERGWSQKHLARKAGIGQTTVSLYLDPQRDANPTLTKIEAMARALGVTVWQLLLPEMGERRLGSPQLNSIVRYYSHSRDEGRAFIERVAEREAAYSTSSEPPPARNHLTSKRPPGAS